MQHRKLDAVKRRCGIGTGTESYPRCATVIMNGEVRPFDPDALIALPSELPELGERLVEPSQPTYKVNQVGKIIVDKMAGSHSPDRADSLMIAFQPATSWIKVWQNL
jgi:hypothetical protein